MYKRQDFNVLDEFLEGTEDLPGPTREFESRNHPNPDNLGELLDEEENLPRPPSPVIPQPRTSPRKVRHDWARARGNLSPEHLPSEDDEEMGSKNEEDPKDPTYSPSESPMDSDEDPEEGGPGDKEDSIMEPEEQPATPSRTSIPHPTEGF